MAKKPRTNEVQEIIKNLLDSEIPEIQDVARQLGERIKRLEEESGKLEDYISEIEIQATEGADALAEIRIGDLLKDLEKALGELRRRSGGVIARPGPGIEAGERALGELRRSLVGRVSSSEVGEEAEVEGEGEEETEEVGGPEELRGARRLGVEVETYTTPEGFKFRKFRR